MPSETAIDRVGRLERGALAERRQRVAAAELLGLPRAQRLERVHGGHVRDAVDELRQVAAEVRVPGVAVHEVGVRGARRHRQVDRHRAQRGQLGRRRRPARPTPRGAIAPSRSAPQRARRRRSSARSSRARYSTWTPGPAVDLGRVLAREQRDLHASTVVPLGMTTIPPAETGKRSRSASGSTPISRALARSARSCRGSRGARPRCRPTSTPCMRIAVLDLRVGVHVRARREDRAPHGAAGDDHAGAHHRVQRLAAARRPRRRRTWPAAADRARCGSASRGCRG